MATPEIEISLPVPTQTLAAPEARAHVRPPTAVRIFRGAVLYTSAATLLALFFVITGRDGGALFGKAAFSWSYLFGLAMFFAAFHVVWGMVWWGVRWLLLRTVAGFSRAELKQVFSSRMNQPFDLAPFLAAHSERRIRIIDMIGRRGRFIVMQVMSYLVIIVNIASNPTPQFLTSGLQGTLLDAVIFSWIGIGLYYSDGFLGRAFYGAQSRLMDGSLARANCLLITTLWNAFKFVMVPMGIQLALHFPPSTYAALFAFIWLSYVVADASSEVVGSLFGKQKLRVWGIGDVNRKSVAGTWACFLGSLAVCLWMVSRYNLPLPWVGLAFAISLSNTAFELFSPRGTDDFTMATANALLCWAFGVFVL